MRFRLLAGAHVAEDGVTYKKGQVIESDHDLVALFPQKFEPVVGREQPEIEVEEELVPAPAPTPTATPKKPAKPKSKQASASAADFRDDE